MNWILDYAILLFFLIVFFYLYIFAPFLASYYIYKRLWMSDRMRYFIAVSLFIAGMGASALVLAKLML